MKILFLARPDIFELKAGDTIQIEKLREALKSLGILIDLSTEIKPNLAKYDLVHCFNMLRIETCRAQCSWIKKQKKPLVLTPVYWNLEEYLAYNYPERLKWWEIQQKKRTQLLEMVDLLAPNAEGEYKLIERDFSLELPYEIIYNGVEADYIPKINNNNAEFVLSVGRIHPRKNQLNMIKAIKNTNLSLIIIGKINDKQYYRLCKKEADENIKFISQVDRSRLTKYYLKAKVHLMVSWYDTPGLVNLEAGLAGCNLVVSSRGTAIDYFGNKADYCNPYDLDEIKEKILKNSCKKRDYNLRSHILENYTWEKIALNTRQIYRKLLNSCVG